MPAGRYVLKLPFAGNASGDQPARRAFARVTLVVPPIPGGRSDEPLDIGAVPLDVFPFRDLNVGARVPEVIPGGVDSRPLDLGALRGKFVLLVGWSTFRQWSLANLSQARATHEAFGRDPRLIMIGLNEDPEPGPMRRYLAGRDLGWEQRYIGDDDEPNPITSAFGMRFPHAALLIGPDGRLVARELHGEAIREAVARALR